MNRSIVYPQINITSADFDDDELKRKQNAANFELEKEINKLKKNRSRSISSLTSLSSSVSHRSYSSSRMGNKNNNLTIDDSRCTTMSSGTASDSKNKNKNKKSSLLRSVSGRLSKKFSKLTRRQFFKNIYFNFKNHDFLLNNIN